MLSMDPVPGAAIPITQLDPDAPVPSGKSITGIVVLLWPYSSHADSLAVLLAEPDFRLRSRKGQVRIQLKGRPAKSIALTGIGIGDRVTLALDGAVWADSSTAVATPGRSVGADLLFAGRITVGLRNNIDESVTINVEAEAEDIEAATAFRDSSPLPPAATRNLFITPARTRRDFEPGNTWKSPHFPASSSHKSSSFLSFNDDLFADDSGAEDYHALAARDTKRTKFARKSGEWRFDASSPRGSSGGSASTSDHGDADTEPLGGPLADGRASFGVVTGAHRSSPVLLDSPPQEGLPAPVAQANVLPPPASSPTPIVPVLEPEVEPVVEALPEPFVAPSVAQVVPPESEQLVTQNEDQNDTGLTQALEETLLPTSPYRNTAPSPVLPSTSPLLMDSQIDFWRAEPNSSDGRFPPPTTSKSDAIFESQGTEGPAFGLDGSFSLREEQPPDYQGQLIESTDVLQAAQDDQQPPKARRLSIQTSGLFGTALKDKQPTAVDPQPDLSNTDSLRARNSPAIEYVDLLSSTSQDKAGPHGSQDVFAEFLVTSPAKEGANGEGERSSLQTPANETSTNTEPLPNITKGSLQYPLTPKESQEERSVDASSHIHPVDQILSGRLPITPNATLSNLSEMLRPPSESPSEPPTTRGDEEKPLPRTRKKSSRRVVSKVPEVVSPWFSSRRSSDRRSSRRESKPEEPVVDKDSGTREATGVVTPPARATSTENAHDRQLTKSGFRTPLSYYAPLESLQTYLSAASSQGAATVDIMGVVKSSSSTPLRAKSGPRDFHTFLQVIDVSISPKAVQVQCFRRFAHSLPQADIGDVILLRDFAVKSRNNSFFLLSASSSAWYVWRYKGSSTSPSHEKSASNDDEQISHSSQRHEEECRGPPVELGKEEQLHARALRRWWLRKHVATASGPEAHI